MAGAVVAGAVVSAAVIAAEIAGNMLAQAGLCHFETAMLMGELLYNYHAANEQGSLILRVLQDLSPSR